MDTAVQINWEPILWIGGILVSVIVGELSFIVYILKEDRKDIVVRLDHHDKKFRKQQKEIHELRLDTRETLAIIKTKLGI